MKTVGVFIAVVGILLLAIGDTYYALNQLMELSPNDYIFAEFGNPEAQALVQEKEDRDRNRPLAIKIMVGGVILIIVGGGLFLFAWDKTSRKNR